MIRNSITSYTVNHQYSVPTILQAMTPISFMKKKLVPHRSIALHLCRHSNEENCIC